MPVLFDSSVYISTLRVGGGGALLLQRWAQESPIWLSSVVLQELYAGTSSNGLQPLEKLERNFERAKRILIPNLSDWTRAGKVLARLAHKYGYERMGWTRLTNDALIATSASRTGITVITTNQRDFVRLAEFCPLQWQVRMVQA
jgi:predicted nucleic acid-binding protein